MQIYEAVYLPTNSPTPFPTPAPTPAPTRASVTFTYSNGDDEKSTISKTVSGITLTISNPAPNSEFTSDSDGIYLGDYSGGDRVDSFDLTVTGGTILFKSYVIGFGTSAGATFSLSGGSGTSTGNSFNGGTQTANGDWQLEPGQTGTFTATGVTINNFDQLESWTFEVIA